MSTTLRYVAAAAVLALVATYPLAGCGFVESDDDGRGRQGESRFAGDYVVTCASGVFEIEAGFSVPTRYEGSSTLDLSNVNFDPAAGAEDAVGYIRVFGIDETDARVVLEHDGDSIEFTITDAPEAGTEQTECRIEAADGTFDGEALIEFLGS